MNRRKFITNTALGTAAVSTLYACVDNGHTVHKPLNGSKQLKPVVISTWNHGIPANEAAWNKLQSEGKALDAVEIGVMTAEADPKVMSVGYGGFPDREGKVTLDACIMDHQK